MLKTEMCCSPAGLDERYLEGEEHQSIEIGATGYVECYGCSGKTLPIGHIPPQVKR